MIILCENFTIDEMNWLAGWKSKKLEPAWEYKTKGILWRLLPSRDGYIVLEDRDVETKTVSFACIRASSGEICWDDVQFDERWWVNVEAIHEDVVLFHEYATPDMPDHKKITVVDLNNGRTLWSNDENEIYVCARAEYVCHKR